MEKDYRKNQKVIGTLKLEDKGQDFLEIDVLENGVILGNNIMFKNGRLSVMGIGALNGSDYYSFDEIKKDFMNINKQSYSYRNFYIYLKNTEDKKEPLPWKAQTIKYKITGRMIIVEKPNRFIN